PDLILQFIARLLSGVALPPLDIWRVLAIIGVLGVGLIIFILSLLGRGFRERIGREAALAVSGGVAQSDARRHLAAADAAIAARRSTTTAPAVPRHCAATSRRWARRPSWPKATCSRSRRVPGCSSSSA